ncbi:MAG: hypothetical protein ACI8RD_007911, partial [Bacillariaceae sp.]
FFFLLFDLSRRADDDNTLNRSSMMMSNVGDGYE